MEKASACLWSHKGPIFRIFTVSSWTTGQTRSQSDRNLNTTCVMRVILIKQSYYFIIKM